MCDTMTTCWFFHKTWRYMDAYQYILSISIVDKHCVTSIVLLQFSSEPWFEPDWCLVQSSVGLTHQKTSKVDPSVADLPRWMVQTLRSTRVDDTWCSTNKIYLDFTPYSSFKACKWMKTSHDCLYYPPFSLHGLAIMASKSVLWSLFHTNNKLYKSNKSHHNAFCIGCVKLCADQLHSSHSSAVASGELDTVRRDEELKEAGKWISTSVRDTDLHEYSITTGHTHFWQAETNGDSCRALSTFET